MRFILLLTTAIFFVSCVSYDYYRFKNSERMLFKDSIQTKYSRENILFYNQDIRISAKIEEHRLPCLNVSTILEKLNDSLFINDFDVNIIDDSLIKPNRILVTSISNGFYIEKFKDLPIDLRMNPNRTFHFEYECIENNEIGLKIFLDYKVGAQVFSDTIFVHGLNRVKTKSRFVGLH